jgi:hypothetical protein
MGVTHSVRRGNRNDWVVVGVRLEPSWYAQVVALADRNASSLSGAAGLLIKEALEARQAAREGSETA